MSWYVLLADCDWIHRRYLHSYLTSHLITDSLVESYDSSQLVTEVDLGSGVGRLEVLIATQLHLLTRATDAVGDMLSDSTSIS